MSKPLKSLHKSKIFGTMGNASTSASCPTELSGSYSKNRQLLYFTSIKYILAFITLGLLTACVPLERRSAPPFSTSNHASVQGLENIRYSLTTQSGIDAIVADIDEQHRKVPFRNDTKEVNLLSISGGGDNGAFAAGLLNGWSERNDRPRFQLVTGVSTGALIAPFAYLGSDYDHVLNQVYTQVQQKDIFKPIGLLSALFRDSYADSSPLMKLISTHITADVLRKIAHEYNVNHRWLIVGTTNLDAGMPIAWNMGKIASQGTPEALELFKKILLASASIPGAFPPVLFDVEINHQKYQEMHVDGGASTQAFLYPPTLHRNTNNDPQFSKLKWRAYIIRNARLDLKRMEIERRTTSIASRTIEQLIYAQGLGDLYRMYIITQADGVEFNLAFIDSTFNFPHTREFDTKYMKALFEYAKDKASKGYPWWSAPPGIERTLH